MASRSVSVGRSTSRRRGRRRRQASSRSNGRLVATMMKAESSFMPSHSRRNWLMSSRWVDRWEEPPREPRMASASSMKTTQGVSFFANEKIALTFFSPSPTYMSYTSTES